MHREVLRCGAGRRRSATGLGAAALALAGCRAGPAVIPEDAPLEPPQRVRSIEIATADVFSSEQASAHPLYRLVNAVHATSRVQLIERLLWLDPGDAVTEPVARELERELRRTGLFSEATVAWVEVPGEPGVVDLDVRTRDRLSLSVGGSGALVGGVGSVDVQLGESNLFGNGDRILASFRRNSEGEQRSELRYTDRHFLTEEHRATVLVGDTEEGFEGVLGVEKRLRHLADDGRWSAFATTLQEQVDYFDGGGSVLEVPRGTDRLDLSRSRVTGPRDERLELGLQAELLEQRFGAVSGPESASIEVPGDTRSVAATGFVSQRWIDGFAKERGLDSLGFVEDLELGQRVSAAFGAQWRDEEGLEATLAPLASLGAAALFDPLPGTFVSAQTSASLRWRGGEALGWSADAALRGYRRITPSQLLAASAVVEAVFEGEGLPIELTLGEDNGLRGYPAREFAGDRRARLNLEYRIDTGLELGPIRFGVTPFVDGAWIDDSGFGQPLFAAGIGLRLGSEELLGAGVIRIDLGFPLVEPDGREFSPSVSIALGQVFTLLRNAAALSSN